MESQPDYRSGNSWTRYDHEFPPVQELSANYGSDDYSIPKLASSLAGSLPRSAQFVKTHIRVQGCGDAQE